MDNQESGSKWDELAREIGADVPFDEPPPARPKTESKEKPAKPLPAPPKRPRPNWDGLISELGLEPAEPPVEQPKIERPKIEPPVEPARQPVVSAEKAEPRRRKPTTAPARPKPPTDVAVATPAEPPRAEPTPPPAPEKEHARESVSLWHRIFGSPEEQAKKIAEVSRSDESAPPERFVPTRQQAEPTEPRTAAEPIFEEQPEAAEEREETFDEGEAQHKKRRPRRRRRGRGRKGEDQDKRPVEVEEARPEPAEPIEDDEFAPEAGIAAEDVEDSDEDWSETAEPEAASATGRVKSAGHRSIPSWEETIGVLVDLNMQSRAQRRQSGHTESRGRPRGGRRRKKS